MIFHSVDTYPGFLRYLFIALAAKPAQSENPARIGRDGGHRNLYLLFEFFLKQLAQRRRFGTSVRICRVFMKFIHPLRTIAIR